ncbi:MAG TPA: HDOD domain-containing protein [Thiobacillaceae bacterium]|nr:HDOD domain-containing protein [Thiobacillaceae bacterium]
MKQTPHSPPHIVGGGINTGDARQHVAVTNMLGVDNSGPVREAALRARFLSFDPLYNAKADLVAHQLVLRGRAAPAETVPQLRQMEEDMLLTGLYSLAQDGLDGKLPLLIRISSEVLFSDIPKQLDHGQIIWCVDLPDERHLARALALQEADLTLCPTLGAPVRETASAWPYLACRADQPPPQVPARLVVEGEHNAHHQSRWPANTWFRMGLPAATTRLGNPTDEQSKQLELLAVALRPSVDTLIQFFRLNPDMAPRLLAIANSRIGGLSRPAESAAHALVMLGPQRACRVAALLALTGAQPDEAMRNCAVTALSRALFMGKITRLGAPAASAAAAFEIGLLSVAPHALAIPQDLLARRLRLPAAKARALDTPSSSEGRLLQLAYACERGDPAALAGYAKQLEMPLHQVSTTYLDALITASTLDVALQ